MKAGVFLSGEGLKPSSEGARIRYSGSKRIVTDEPFAETKELVAGYAILQFATKAEAIEWTKRFVKLTPRGGLAGSASASSGRSSTTRTSVRARRSNGFGRWGWRRRSSHRDFSVSATLHSPWHHEDPLSERIWPISAIKSDWGCGSLALAVTETAHTPGRKWVGRPSHSAR